MGMDDLGLEKLTSVAARLTFCTKTGWQTGQHLHSTDRTVLYYWTVLLYVVVVVVNRD
jgi:hypothetical protein